MTKKHTSLLNEHEAPFFVPGSKGIDWNATKINLLKLAKAAYCYSVLQCDRYISQDDMRDPVAVILESLRDNTEPVMNMVQYCKQMGMPESIMKEVRNSDWMKMTKTDVVKDLSTAAQKMMKRKIHLRKQREERKQNNSVIIEE